MAMKTCGYLLRTHETAMAEKGGAEKKLPLAQEPLPGSLLCWWFLL
jgi:hypothetical protein